MILGHTFCYAFTSTENLLFLYVNRENPMIQLPISALLGAETFFVLGGFLMAYSLNEYRKKNPTKSVFRYVLKKIFARYININVSFCVILLIATTIAAYLNDTSQFLMHENMEGNCKKYWWRNLLFIQNLFPFEEFCMSWSWHAAADFQLFALCSILIAIKFK